MQHNTIYFVIDHNNNANIIKRWKAMDVIELTYLSSSLPQLSISVKRDKSHYRFQTASKQKYRQDLENFVSTTTVHTLENLVSTKHKTEEKIMCNRVNPRGYGKFISFDDNTHYMEK